MEQLKKGVIDIYTDKVKAKPVPKKEAGRKKAM